MNALSSLFAGSALALMLAAPAAHAVSLTSVSTGGNTVSTDFFSPSLISADIGFSTTAPVVLNMTVDGDEVGGLVDFNAVIDNLMASSVSQWKLALGGAASFSVVGSVETLNNLSSAVVTFNNGVATALVTLPVAESAVYLGDTFGTGMNWQVNLGNMAAGEAFSLSISPVPEADSLALVLTGLASIAAVSLRRKTA